ncbi:MAG: aminoglycoside phosphotransferase family protein [Rhizobiaceae bacterium]|nr:aminoglycoside phosphotransferase family protein [Rhizobiaceae bacterium]MCV0407496.1 aminoglycoside phosphotransferase family protein [Rhizobiaceae bacterium]
MPPANSGHQFAIDTVRAQQGDFPPDARVEHRLLSGGLEASHVSLTTIRFLDRRGKPRVLRTVLKQLDGWMVREASIYRNLVARYASELSPRLLAVEHPLPGRAYLCIEAVRRVSAWPWRDVDLSGRVLRDLATFHREARLAPVAMSDWNFDAELAETAEHTATALDRCRKNPRLRKLTRGLPALTRLAHQQAHLREQLFAEAPFGSGPIHGDVHSGNVLVRQRQSRPRPVFLDWARARLGSPLEDISSWLQSLGIHEREARRRHDALLHDYLSEIGHDRRIGSSLRAAYWIASARNALGGALLHHIRIAEDERRHERERLEAYRMARDWVRVIRRADAWSAG